MSRLREDASEAGATVMELVVVVLVFGIIVTSIFGVMNNLTAAEQRAQLRVQTQEDIREALTAMARDLRSSAGLEIASSAAATQAITLIGSDNARTRWRVLASTGRLLREVDPSNTGQWVPSRTYRDVRNGADAIPLLRYYGAGNVQFDPSTTLPSTLSKCALRVRLTLRAGPVTGSVYTSTQDVSVRNRGSRGVAGC
ncbi:MAG: hypothetical protein KY439_07155 [Actinobacteria bacterium]|nr:hypothetical protein [Actinomycetota bacterium]